MRNRSPAKIAASSPPVPARTSRYRSPSSRGVLRHQLRQQFAFQLRRGARWRRRFRRPPVRAARGRRASPRAAARSARAGASAASASATGSQLRELAREVAEARRCRRPRRDRRSRRSTSSRRSSQRFELAAQGWGDHASACGGARTAARRRRTRTVRVRRRVASPGQPRRARSVASPSARPRAARRGRVQQPVGQGVREEVQHLRRIAAGGQLRARLRQRLARCTASPCARRRLQRGRCVARWRAALR